MSVKIERYLNRNKKSPAYGKTYGRVVHNKRVIGVRALASHIQSHGSIYTHDVIVGVLAKAEQCMAELIGQGYKVKLEGIGTFALRIAKQTGTENTEDYTLDNIERYNLRFIAEQSSWSPNKATALTRGASQDGIELLDYVVEHVDKQTGKRVITYLTTGSSGSGSGSGSNSGGSGNSNDDPDIERP